MKTGSSQPLGATATGGAGIVRSSPPLSVVRRIRHAVVLAVIAVAVVTAIVMVPLQGWSYYSKPLRVRGLHQAHSLLRPSGTVGRSLGVAGAALMLAMQLYSLRKRKPRLLRAGSVPAWLEFHIFCGIVGPCLITLHTSFKFNGIVSVAYWSMVLVMLSGFVGRYLYVRIPRTLRGQEMSLQEMEASVAAFKERLLESHLAAGVLAEIDRLEGRASGTASGRATLFGLVFGDFGLRRELRRFKRRLRRDGLPYELLERAAGLVRDRAEMLRRITYLRKTKQLFALWHVFHQPLAVVMLVIVILHVGTAVYFGYGLFGR